MTDIEIIPAVIPQSLDGLEHRLEFLSGSGATTVQIDVTDGVFVENRSWPMNRGDMKYFRPLAEGEEGLPLWDEFNFEVDLMVHDPEKFLAQWILAGVTRAVIHLESQHNFVECKAATEEQIELGLAVELDTPYETITPYIPKVDYLQVMGIATLGKQGEPFDERAVVLIQRLRKDFPDVTIQVDGGVTDDTAPLLVEAGANRLVSGSFILKSDNAKEAISDLYHSLHTDG